MAKGPDCDYDNGSYPWYFVTQIHRSDLQSHGGDGKSFRQSKTYLYQQPDTDTLQSPFCFEGQH